MNKLFLSAASAILALSVGAAAFAATQKPAAKTTCSVEHKKEVCAKKSYTCPMHSSVKSEKPGKCPDCGMNLVERKEQNKQSKQKTSCPGHHHH